MGEVSIAPATPAHVGTIAARAREIDREECDISSLSVKHALRYGLQYSDMVFTVKIDGRPEAMFGVRAASMLDGVGKVWLVATDELPKHPRALVTQGRVYRDVFLGQYRVLENIVHANNLAAIRWLKFLGFEIGEEREVRGHIVRDFRLCVTQRH